MTPSPESSSSSPRWMRTARHLLDWPQWRDSVRLVPQPSLWISIVSGLQVALSGLLVMAAVYASPWRHLVGFAAIGALTALFGRFAPLAERRRIVTVCALLMTLAVLVPSLCALAGATPWMMVGVLTLSVGALTLLVNHLRLGVPGAVILVFAVGAALGPVDSVRLVLEHSLATLFGGLAACGVCMATDGLRRASLVTLQLPPPARYALRTELLVAGRVTLGAGLSAFIAYGAGWEHPAWAAIGATAVMQGAHLHTTMSRALQRMVGTMAGAALCLLIMSYEPSFWVMVAWMVVFQFATEVLMGSNYALGQLTVTPMALMMTHMAAAPVQAGAHLPLERVMDTVLGAVLGIVFAVIFSTAQERQHLAQLRSGPARG